MQKNLTEEITYE